MMAFAQEEELQGSERAERGEIYGTCQPVQEYHFQGRHALQEVQISLVRDPDGETGELAESYQRRQVSDRIFMGEDKDREACGMLRERPKVGRLRRPLSIRCRRLLNRSPCSAGCCLLVLLRNPLAR
jgi:hypothetical protein